jgi:DNA polymerase alpha/epsilon subunit B
MTVALLARSESSCPVLRCAALAFHPTCPAPCCAGVPPNARVADSVGAQRTPHPSPSLMRHQQRDVVMHDASGACRYTRGQGALDIMRDQMRQRHLCASAPDTLACYPYSDSDPFIVRSAPHVYFTGNQAAFGAECLACGEAGSAGGHVQLISIPAFAVTGQIVLVDLASLEAETVTISATL